MKTFVKLVEETEVPEQAPDHVFLFHGTSTSKLSSFMRVGLRQPKGFVFDFMMDTVLGYLKTIFGIADPFSNVKAKEYAVRYTNSYIQDTRNAESFISQEQDNCIYMSLDHHVARTFADQNARYGSEAEYEAFSIAKGIACGIFHFEDAYSTNPPFDAARGVVVGAKVPIERTSLNAYQWKKAYEKWKRLVTPPLSPSQCFQTYFTAKWFSVGMDEEGSNEVRVYSDIPENDIYWGIPYHFELDQIREFIFRVVGV